jgi:hypothetical protein
MRRPVSAGCIKLPRIDALEGAKKRRLAMGKISTIGVSESVISKGSQLAIVSGPGPSLFVLLGLAT